MFLSSWSVAQVQPQPRESEPQDRQMPNYLPDEAPADIPNMEFLRGHGTDPVTGEPHYYMDPESGLYFDFREKIIRDFKTGKAYTFKELEKLLRKEPEKPEVPKKSRI
ncbi:MAG: hypothetical protein ACLFUB_07975 [Cyclobacteriaceae bacterium]